MTFAEPESFDELRESYGQNLPLAPADLADGWWSLLERWIADAAEHGTREPNAMVLATLAEGDAAAAPRTRTVLCKGVSPEGVRFFTTRTSRKGRQLAAHPFASATFPLLERERQVHLSGSVVPLDDAACRDYWGQRPRGSQIAAWASSQSEPVDGLDALVRRLDEETARFGGPDGKDEVPMPPWWGGYLLRPERAEFWQGGADRFHDRLVAGLDVDEAASVDGAARLDPASWTVVRLQP